MNSPKRLLLLLLLLLIPGCEDSGEGIIRRKECRYTDQQGKMNGRHIVTFNEYGKRTSDESYDADDNIINKFEYLFDDTGNLKEEIWYESENRIVYRSVYYYDNNGLVNRSARYDKNGIITSRSEYVYDVNRSLVGVFHYSREGNLVRYSRISEENSNGRKKRIETEYNQFDVRRRRDILTFDKDGNMTSFYVYDENNILKRKGEIVYKQTGEKIVTYELYDLRFPGHRNTSYYNSLGVIVKAIIERNHGTTIYRITEYKRKGNILAYSGIYNSVNGSFLGKKTCTCQVY